MSCHGIVTRGRNLQPSRLPLIAELLGTGYETLFSFHKVQSYVEVSIFTPPKIKKGL